MARCTPINLLLKNKVNGYAQTFFYNWCYELFMYRKKLIASFLLVFITLSLFAQNGIAAKQKHWNLAKSVAIQGYDPVSYFTNKPTKGNASISIMHDGVKYYFATEANKKAFLLAPAKYEPQYGGWCAFAMGEQGIKVEINPRTFKIINGKLYLFFNEYFNNTLKTWNKDEPKLLLKANKNWDKLIK